MTKQYHVGVEQFLKTSPIETALVEAALKMKCKTGWPPGHFPFTVSRRLGRRLQQGCDTTCGPPMPRSQLRQLGDVGRTDRAA